MKRALQLAFVLLGCGRTGLHGDRDRDGSVDDDDPPQTCREVDFLFVIDNSDSMADNQAKVLAHFDVFLDGISRTVERLDSIHVGVVTSDAYEFNNATCRDLGGLVVETGGRGSSSRACGPYADGHNYMSDADDLSSAFRCAAQVGTGGSARESTLTAAIAAISSPMTDRGACNEGFLRPGALLVLVVVTDEDTDLDPLVALEQLTAAKDDEDLVLVVLANGPNSGCSGDSYGRVADQLARVTSLFTHGFIGPICAPSYDDVFADAVEVVEDACPVG